MRLACAVAQMQKQMRILENRLEKTYHKYSSRKLQIGSLRDHIDNLRRERLVFDDVHRKLEKGLASEKREMGAIILQSNMSHEGRERVRGLPILSLVEHSFAVADTNQELSTKLIQGRTTNCRNLLNRALQMLICLKQSAGVVCLHCCALAILSLNITVSSISAGWP